MKAVAMLLAALLLPAAPLRAWDHEDSAPKAAETERRETAIQPPVNVAPDGSNLRQVLAETGIAAEVIPLTPRLSFVVLNAANKRAVSSFYEDYIKPLCKREWMVQVLQRDPLTDRETMVWKPVRQDFYGSALDSGLPNTEEVWLNCSGAFVMRVDRELLMADMRKRPPIRLGTYVFIEHAADQPFVWKSDRIGNPDGMTLPEDGLLDHSHFALKRDQLLKTIDDFHNFMEKMGARRVGFKSAIDKALDFLRILGWMGRKCSTAGGVLSVYRETVEGTRRIGPSLDMPVNLAYKHYISCGGKSPVFVLRTDNLAFRKGVSYETMWK